MPSSNGHSTPYGWATDCLACALDHHRYCTGQSSWCPCFDPTCLPPGSSTPIPGGPMTNPLDQPEQTDNRPRPEDGEQDVTQDAAIAYDELDEDGPQ